MSSNPRNSGLKKLKELLPHGSQKAIAEKLKLSKQAVSDALNEGKTGHPAVIEAVRLVRESGGLDAARLIQELNEQPVNAANR